MVATARARRGAPWWRSGGPSGRGVRIVAVLATLYVLELLAQAIGVDVTRLGFDGFVGAPAIDVASSWTLVTRLLVERPEPAAVLTVLVSLWVLYSLWPTMEDALGLRPLVEAMVACVLAGTLSVVGVALLPAYTTSGVIDGTAMGWTPNLAGLLCLFGLVYPHSTVRLNFVLPVPAWVFVWGSLALALLQLVSAMGSNSPITWPMELLGVWVGAYGWYHLRGPGRRRRVLKSKVRGIERELTRLTVLPGGRDDVVHRGPRG